MSGWIKIHRQLDQHWLSEDPERFGAWVSLILMANHQPRQVLIGAKLIEVERGSFITSQRKLQQKWGWSREKFDAYFALLKAEKMLTYKTTHQYTYVSITNYDTYQGITATDTHTNQHTDTHTDTHSTDARSAHEPTTNKNDKNLRIKELKNKDITPPNKSEVSPGVWLSELEIQKLITDHGEEFYQACLSKLSAWIDQEPTAKRKRNGKNAGATIRVWVANAVAREQADLNRRPGPARSGPAFKSPFEQQVERAMKLLEE